SCCVSRSALAQSVSVPSAADLAPTLTGSAASDDVSTGVTYSYTLANSSSSHQAAMLLAISFGLTHASVVSSPFRWGASDQIGEAHLLGWSARVGAEVQPGSSVTGFVIHADGLPGITDSYVVGDVPIDQLPVFSNNSAPDTIPGSSVTENSVHLRTI